jgi:hypothetical protein
VKRIVLVCFFLVSLGWLTAAPAADVTGQWAAQTMMGSSGSEMPVPTTFTFKVEGTKLTGTVSSPRGKFEITEGKIDGDSIKFSIVMTAGNTRSKMLYDGRIKPDGIDFISKIEGGDRSDQFLAKRSTS